ncbi:hypothetical protein LTR95_004166 [Oleoguttula sp. CCFEE 5521]
MACTSVLQQDKALEARTCYPTPPVLRTSSLMRHEAMPAWATRLRTEKKYAAAFAFAYDTIWLQLIGACAASVNMIGSMNLRGVKKTLKENQEQKEKWQARKEELAVLMLCVEPLASVRRSPPT